MQANLLEQYTNTPKIPNFAGNWLIACRAKGCAVCVTTHVRATNGVILSQLASAICCAITARALFHLFLPFLCFLYIYFYFLSSVISSWSSCAYFQCQFSTNYADLEFTVLFCRPTPPWPSQDSLASYKSASAVSVHPGYLICAFINTLFARSVGNRYVILLLFAMNVVLGLPTSAKFTWSTSGRFNKRISMEKAKAKSPPFAHDSASMCRLTPMFPSLLLFCLLTAQSVDIDDILIILIILIMLNFNSLNWRRPPSPPASIVFNAGTLTSVFQKLNTSFQVWG